MKAIYQILINLNCFAERKANTINRFFILLKASFCCPEYPIIHLRWKIIINKILFYLGYSTFDGGDLFVLLQDAHRDEQDVLKVDDVAVSLDVFIGLENPCHGREVEAASGRAGVARECARRGFHPSDAGVSSPPLQW